MRKVFLVLRSLLEKTAKSPLCLPYLRLISRKTWCLRNLVMLTGGLLMITACTTSLLPKKNEAPVDYEAVFEAAYNQLQIAAPAVRENKQPLVLAHYMPWFQKYGFHWQQGGANFDPAEILSDGRANIASHYYPLTGPYDSSDPSLLEYQAALMKISGIDGVVIDWYGVTEGVDYKSIHEATVALIETLKKRGLAYAIVYEDQSVKHLIEFGVIPKDQGRSAARETFAWMQENWFQDDLYVKVDGRPLVLCFGPQYFYQRSEWDEIWTDVSPKPFFIDLDARTNWADGTKSWSPMHLSSGGKLSIPSLVKYLNDFYQKQNAKPFVVGTAMPGFHDIYAQAGGRSYGFLDYSNGETFKLTYTAAEQARANIIQVQTWNDYGEGTIIEPTIEHGYRELEYLQDKRKQWEADFPFNYSDLRIPIELYKIAVSEKSTDEQKQQVADLYEILFSGDANAFRQAVRDANIRYDFSVNPLLGEPAGNSSASAVAFDPAGRRNMALGKPAVASSKIDVWTVNKIVDGDVATYWEGAARQYPGTIYVDLVTSARLSTLVIKLNPQRMWAKRVQRFEVQVSDNGADFTTVAPEADYQFDPVSNANTVVIPLNVTARYVQLVFTANSGATNGQVAELEVYGE
ncbi:MAG: discoidin domain-containing protein [Treponema sp.]|nr:discoidin domain-containing protein [Treponema sp.]